MNNYYQKILLPMARISLFIIYFWFGILKVLDLSPASNLVQDLFTKTIPFMSFHVFFILFGIFECLIGIFFLIKGLEKIVIPMFIIHIITTFGPLLFLPSETWVKIFDPSLEGQYIIKNLALITCALIIYGQLKFKKAKTG